MIASTYSHRLAKAGYALGATMILLVIGLWIVGPILIEQAFKGNLLPFLSSVVIAQSIHPLSRVMSAFYELMTPATVLIVWIAVLLAHMTWQGQRVAHAFVDRDAAVSRSVVNWMVAVSSYSVLILASLFFLLVYHGNTYLTIMTHDTFIFFDGAHRINSGQVPHKDFHTPIGAVAYWLPCAGLLLKGRYAGCLELVSFLVAAASTLLSVVLLWRRSSAFLAILTIAYLAILVAVPIFVDSSGIAITHAMFYNRWAWAALTLIFITYIAPQYYSTGRLVLEAILLALLIVFLLFLKITYFLVAIIFLFVLACESRRQRILAIGAGAMSLLFWGVIEWHFSITGSYLEDVRAAILASGVMRQHTLLPSVMYNVVEFLLIITAIGILISKRAVRWQELLFVAFVSGAGLAIVNQNAQSQNIVVLLVILLWGHRLILREQKGGEIPAHLSETCDARIMKVLLILFVAPQLISGAHGVVWRSIGLATSAKDEQVPLLQGVYIGEVGSYLDNVRPEASPVLLFNELRAFRPRQPLSQSEYVETINGGVRLLDAQGVRSGKIITFDLANPFNFLTHATPAKGDYSWWNAWRNITKTTHVVPATLFRDVDYVMLPAFPMAYKTTRLLWEIYGGHVTKHYVVLAKNKYWTLYGRPKADSIQGARRPLLSGLGFRKRERNQSGEGAKSRHQRFRSTKSAENPESDIEERALICASRADPL